MIPTPPSRFRRLAPALPLLLALLPTAVQGAVNDIYPADYVALPAGTSTATAYLIDRHNVGPYVRGKQQAELGLDNHIFTLRFGHFLQTGSVLWAPTLVLPSLSMEMHGPTPLRNALGPTPSGMSDVRIGATAWLHADSANIRHLALGGMLILPTAQYRPTQALNLGENRTRAVFTLGGVTPLSNDGKWLLEGAQEVAFYGANNDAAPGGRRLTQRPSTAFTGYLRYRFTRQWHVHLGWQENWGGATAINGTDQHNAPNNRRHMLGFTWQELGKHQLIVRYAREPKVDNGFRTKEEWALRYMRIF